MIKIFSKMGQLKIQVLKNYLKFLVPQFSKGGQLKIQEMSFMLVAVIVFFILAGLFAISILYSNLHKEATNLAEEKTLSSISNLASTPEFSCSIDKPNCVDSDKLIVMLNRPNYKNYWPFSSLTIIKSSANNKTENKMVSCNIQNYPNCDKFIVFDKKVSNERVISSYVALCRKEYENNYNYDKCEIAKMFVGTEVK
jgi:hypothetical protein